jgi:hypothetical protein
MIDGQHGLIQRIPTMDVLFAFSLYFLEQMLAWYAL